MRDVVEPLRGFEYKLDLMHSAPRFSIIVPCYNQGTFVHDAIRSVLEQTSPAHEIIVVDDGSTDAWTSDRLDALHQPPVRLVRQKNRGLSGARNAGIAVATGDWILPLDADDRLEPDALATYARAIASAPGVDIWYPDVHHFGLAESFWHCPEFNRWRQLQFNQMICSSAIRREVFEAGVYYNEQMRRGYEDWEFFIHATCDMDFIARALKEPVFRYRKWGHSMISDSDAHRHEIIAQLHQERPVFSDPERLLSIKRESCPFFSVAARSPKLRASLERQLFQDWKVADEAGTILNEGSLRLFQRALGRQLLVSLDEAALSRCLDADPHLLEKVALLCVSRRPGMVWLVTTDREVAYPGLERTSVSNRDRCVGVVVSPAHLFDHPRSQLTPRGMLEDLAAHILHHHPSSGIRCIVGRRLKADEGVAVPHPISLHEEAAKSPSALDTRFNLIGSGASMLTKGVLGEHRYKRVLNSRFVHFAARAADCTSSLATRLTRPADPSPTSREWREGPFDLSRHQDRRHRDDAWFVIQEPPLPPARFAHGVDSLLIAVPWIIHGGVDRAIVELLAGLALVAPNVRKYLVTTAPAEMRWAPDVLPHIQGVFSVRGDNEESGSQLCHLIERLGIGTLLIANSKAALDALPSIRRMERRVRVICQAHNFEIDHATGALHGQAAYAASHFNNLIDGYTAISEDTRRLLTERLYVSPSKIRVVHLGVDVGRFAGARRERFCGRPSSVLWLGRMTFQKDPLLAVEVAQAWKKKHGANSLRFTLAGAGELSEEVHDAVARAGLQQMVSIPGPIEDPLALYRDADCLMLTSQYEGVPVVVYEAIASGLPILTPTENTAIEEILHPDEFAQILARGDVDAYVEALENWLANPTLANSQAQLLVARSGEFDRSRYAKETLDLLVPSAPGTRPQLHGSLQSTRAPMSVG